jgi:hypothetical protein
MNWLIFFSSVLWKCSLVSWFDSCSRYYHESSWSPCRNWFWNHPEVAVPLRCWVDKKKFIVYDWIFQHDIMRQNPGSVILDDEITSTLIISFTYYLCIKETSAILYCICKFIIEITYVKCCNKKITKYLFLKSFINTIKQ